MTTYPNPGAIADVVTNNKIESTWGDAIRDRVVQNFATAAARDAAITSPVVGQMCCILSGTGQLQFLQYMGATDGWRPPWNLPWGVVAEADVNSNQGTFTADTDITGLTVTFTAFANRRYRITASTSPSSSVAADIVSMTLKDGTSTQLNIWRQTISATGQSFALAGEHTEVPGAGSITRKISMARVAGTGNITNNAAATHLSQLCVEDIGPIGNQS